jgi:CRP-like cAMP-binding protein
MEHVSDLNPIQRPRPPIGIWLSADPPHASVEPLVLELLEPNFPNPVLRRAAIEELGRGVKLADVVVESLGLRTVAVEEHGGHSVRLVTAQLSRDPWREALVALGSDRPIGLIIQTADAGPLVLVHDVFARFEEREKDLVRRYAELAVGGASHERIVTMLGRHPAFGEALSAAGRTVQLLDPAVLFSPDGATRVQLGSPSQTTKDILREGLRGEQIFILPASLFESKTNYGDVEFLVYLNFFLRQQTRTRIVGTARQRDILHRLLTLTLFGLFDPSAPDAATFDQVRAAYGVDSRETYDFLRAAHENYGARRGPEPGSPLLGIDDYVDFITLHPEETVIALTAAEVRVAPRGRVFHVRIRQSDGKETEKDLEVAPARRRFRAIPGDLREAIQFATDRPRFGVTPLGTSHGFDPGGDFTTFIVWINGRGMLVDPSPDALAHLDRIGVAAVDVPYVFLTHVHSDHDGGLIEKLLSGSRTTVIAADPVFRAFAEKAWLVTGHDFAREGLVEHIRANPGTRVRIPVAGEFAEIETRWNLHPIPTTGFKLSFAGRSFGYSGDTQYEPALLERLRDHGQLSTRHFDDLMYFLWTRDGKPTVDLLYHEAGIPPIHTDKEQLRALPPAVTNRMSLVHIADRDVPDGFVPAKPRLFETQVLVPPTARSREQLLLDTMRLVAYLYDVPEATLETLLRGGDLVTHPPEAVIVRKGPIGANEPLHFHIVTDGRVNVRDGRRVIVTLAKADTFGEWGISHQRGFRAADVVAESPSQTLRLGEEHYHWLVDKHPIIQERLGTIRTLLPRLQLAQGRARLKAGTQPGGHSVIEGMSTTQLSSLAIFSTVQTFKQGHPVTVRADEVDGFYVLLWGHLAVGINGRIIAELSEGDIFGEQGLLEGGASEVDVTAVSVDAEALFVSTLSLQNLLRTVPTFGWGIWETVAGRRESIRVPPLPAP